ncbi:hypothetical protein LIA77_11305 [Sarocladium implicatum]|nr:hypothetical protein LIA77_11305 [Sarocladium implicatum]
MRNHIAEKRRERLSRIVCHSRMSRALENHSLLWQTVKGRGLPQHTNSNSMNTDLLHDSCSLNSRLPYFSRPEQRAPRPSVCPGRQLPSTERALSAFPRQCAASVCQTSSTTNPPNTRSATACRARSVGGGGGDPPETESRQATD